MPVRRNLVVAFLEAEKLRCDSGRKRRREENDASDADGIEDADVVLCAHPRASCTESLCYWRKLRAGTVACILATQDRESWEKYLSWVSRLCFCDYPCAHGYASPAARVGPMVLTNCLNAVSTIGSLFNLLWSGSSCEYCSRWRVDVYTSAGSFSPPVSVVRRRKREAVLQNQATGAKKAIGKRDAVITDKCGGKSYESSFCFLRR